MHLTPGFTLWALWFTYGIKKGFLVSGALNAHI
jgi:hypothetical protein